MWAPTVHFHSQKMFFPHSWCRHINRPDWWKPHHSQIIVGYSTVQKNYSERQFKFILWMQMICKSHCFTNSCTCREVGTKGASCAKLYNVGLNVIVQHLSLTNQKKKISTLSSGNRDAAWCRLYKQQGKISRALTAGPELVPRHRLLYVQLGEKQGFLPIHWGRHNQCRQLTFPVKMCLVTTPYNWTCWKDKWDKGRGGAGWGCMVNML